MTCLECGTVFQPGKTSQGRERRFCRTTCSRIYHGKHFDIRKRVEARKAACADAIREKLRAEFGPLSARDIALYRWVWRVAYNRGYGTGQRNPRRAVAA